MSTVVTLFAGRQTLVDDDTAAMMVGRTWGARRSRHTAYVSHQYAEDGKKKSLLLHRMIMGAKVGEVVDHINGDGLDNRRENLRICTVKQNTCNSRSRRAGCYKGVFQRGAAWTASIMADSLPVALGTFKSEIEAAVAYDRAAVELHGEFAKLNFSADRDWILPELTHGKRWTRKSAKALAMLGENTAGFGHELMDRATTRLAKKAVKS